MPSDGENDRADEPFSRENSTGSPIISKHGYRSATDAQVFPGCCSRSLLLISSSSIFLYVSSCKLRWEEDNTSLNMETKQSCAIFRRKTILQVVFFFKKTGFQVSTMGNLLYLPWHFPIQVVCVSTRKCCDQQTKHLKASCVSTWPPKMGQHKKNASLFFCCWDSASLELSI